MSNINSNDVLINIDNAESEISIINSKEITKSNSTIKNESLIENSAIPAIILATDEVKIVEQDSAYYFDGAKVQEEAYAEILSKLDQKGIDGYLMKMPLNFALFGRDKATDMINNNKKKNYMNNGGAMAAMYAADHANEIDGLAMLAAYSTKKLPNKMKVVSIVGTNDKILKWESYNKNLINLPENYTEGDGTSTISVEEQHEQTVNAILEKFK
ncbi:hypothetical protein H8356DRAFT_1361486 [Neocallimastix lanati (nom. inval.)]|nr:hypothetical protein H8356DRAFT_1361486 [Neocallimastix sp. JGI-2020a]